MPQSIERRAYLRDTRGRLYLHGDQILRRAESEHRRLTANEEASVDMIETLLDLSGEARSTLAHPERLDAAGYRSITEFLRDVKTFVVHPAALPQDGKFAVSQRAASGMGEAIPADGGFLVPQQFAAQIWIRTLAQSPILSRALNVPATGAKLLWPQLSETSRVDGSRWGGGFQAYWVDEAATITPTKPRLGQVELPLFKLIGACYATDELVQDGTGFEPFLREIAARELSFQIERMLYRGTGSGQPLGLLNASSTISQAKESAQTATTISSGNLTKMWARLHSGARNSSTCWLVNQDAEAQFLAAAATFTGLLTPAREGAGAAFMGAPILAHEAASTLGTVGDVLLADPSQLCVFVTSQRFIPSIHVRFVNAETTFKFSIRVNAQPLWQQALTPLYGTVTQSMAVTLATRL